MAATLEAMLDLVHGHREREAIVGEVSAWVLREIGKTPGRQGRALLLKSIADHPRMTMLSLQHRWAQTPWRRFKRRLSTELSSLAALAYATRRRALKVGTAVIAKPLLRRPVGDVTSADHMPRS